VKIGVIGSFKKSEDFEEGASEYHGAGGPLEIRVCPDESMRSEHFLVGATELGYDGPHWDYNGARQENGAGLLMTRKITSCTFIHCGLGVRKHASHVLLPSPPENGQITCYLNRTYHVLTTLEKTTIDFKRVAASVQVQPVVVFGKGGLC
jgi:GMC oxidoreductase